MDNARDMLAAQNQALREANQGLLVTERMLVPISELRRLEVTESNGTAYRAKVSQCDRLNQNHRVYPEHEWAAQLELAQLSLIPAGKLTGSVDHRGALDGGNLKDTCILWRKLEKTADGAIEGEFSIVSKHSRGADLQAQIDAGMAIGFSTVGYATGRQPTDAERARYGIPESDELAVIIENFRLKKIDAVDDPSVPDAWKHETTESTQPESPMNSLADLQAQHPDLHSLHTQAIADAVAAKQVEMTALIDALKAEAQAQLQAAEALKAYLAAVIQTLGKEHAIEVPFREVAEKEAAEKIDALTRDLGEKEAQIADLSQKVSAAEAEKTAAAAAAAQVQRQAQVQAKAESLLAHHRFAVPLRKLITKALEAADFDCAALEALIAEKTAEYEAIAAPTPSAFEITGITGLPDEQQQEETALPIAKELAESL